MMNVDDLNLEPIVRAQGVALALIGTLLERRADLPAGEYIIRAELSQAGKIISLQETGFKRIEGVF